MVLRSRYFSLWMMLFLGGLSHVWATQTAGNGYYAEKDEGWFFYKDPREIKPGVVAPANPPPLLDEDKPYTVKWLQKNLDTLRQKAIDHPDDEKAVKAYMYATRIALDKAQNFANAAYALSRRDPNLDEENLFPMSGPGMDSMKQEQRKALEDAMKILSQKGGLFYFYHSQCAWCERQYDVVRILAGTYGFHVKPVSLDNKPLPGLKYFLPDNGMAKKLGVTMTPTLIYAMPPSSMAVVSQGFGSVDTLSGKLAEAGRHFNIFSPDLLGRLDFVGERILKPEDMRGDALVSRASDTDRLNEWIGNKMQQRRAAGVKP